MVTSSANTVEDYVAKLPPERRAAIATVREVILDNLPDGYVETMSLYLLDVYMDPEAERWFHERYTASGKRLDKGKSCVRFRKLDDLPLDLIGEAVARAPVDQYIGRYESVRMR